MDFINPSLPYIMKELQVSQAATKGLIVVYIITLGVAQFFYGAYADNHGRKKAILIAFIIAIVGFIVSATSQNILMLYIGRCLTAMGTGGCPVIARALISDVCTDNIHLKKAFSYFAMSSQASPAFAPVLGGYIQQYANWHWSFITLAFINALIFLILFFYMPESHQLPTHKKAISKQIALYLNFLKHRQFMIFNFLSALTLVFTAGYYGLSPFIFHTLGFSPVENALFYPIYGIGIILGALFLSTGLAKYNSEKTFLITVVILPLFFIFYAVLFFLLNNIFIIISFSFLLAFMCGIASPLTLLLCLQNFNENKGAASAMQGFMRWFFAGIALFIFNSIELHSFVTLALIFLIISLLMPTLYILNRNITTH